MVDTLSLPILRAGSIDVARSFGLWRSWLLLARQSIQGSYRRTVLGPFWISVQQLVFIFGVGFLYSQLFRVQSRDLLPVLGYGMLAWGLISGLVTQASNLFVGAAQPIASSTLPLAFYPLQQVATSLLTFLHSAAVMVVVPVLYGKSPTALAAVLTPLALVLIVVNGVAVSLWLGPLGARFRDLSTAITVSVPLFMFLTPVFWDPDQLPGRHWAVVVNPFAWPIQSFRDPLLGNSPDVLLWLLFLGATVVNCVIGLLTFSATHRQIRYWL